jgi:hypothetical protein
MIECWMDCTASEYLVQAAVKIHLGDSASYELDRTDNGSAVVDVWQVQCDAARCQLEAHPVEEDKMGRIVVDVDL